MNIAKKPRILIFTGAFSSGGAEKQSILLAKTLKNNNFEILIISYFGEKKLQRYIDLLEHEHIDYLCLTGSILKKIKSFYNFCKSFNPDIIINYLPSNNIIGGFVGKLQNVKHIYGNVRNSRLGKLRYFELLFSNVFLDTKTIFNNESGLNYYTKKGFIKRKCVFIPNVIHPIPPPIVRYKNKKIHILMVSRFEPQKDYQTAIEVFKRLLNDSSYKLKITIIGIGSLEQEIKALIKESKITSHIEILKNPENIMEYYANADIFIQTSLFEGISNSILEAMSYSLPIVATKVGDNESLISHEKNGFLTPKKDVDSLTNYMNQLINNDDLRIEMGKESYLKVNNQYSMEKFTTNYTNLFNGRK